MTCVVSVGVVASACGLEASGPGATPLKIGVIAPLSGALAPFGQGIRKSAELAVELANEANAVRGRKIELVPADDGADPQRGADAASKLVREGVVAVVGTYNSGVAEKIQPILDRAGVAMLSPGNTLPTLTMGPDWQSKPDRPFRTYFRVVATDREQGQLGARYAFDVLKRRRAVVIHERKAVSKGLALVYADSFRRQGGAVADVIELNGKADIGPAVAKAKAKSPDIVFFGGEYPVGGLVAKEMFDAGLAPPAVPMFGGDGLVDKDFVKIAGTKAAQGHYASLVGASVGELPGGRAFAGAYVKRYGTTDWNSFGAPAFDATNIVIRAVTASGATVAGRTLIDAIQTITYRGVLGTTTFDAFGDTTNRILTINRVDGDRFKPLGILKGDQPGA